MEGLCPKCMKPVSGGRFCPHCGHDLLQGLPGQGQSFYTAPVEPNGFYTAPVRRPEPEPVHEEPVPSAPQPVTKPGRVRKLPILLGAAACLAVFLFFPKEEEPVAVMEPLQMPEFTMPEITVPEVTMPEATEPPIGWSPIFQYEAEDLTVTVDHDRVMTITVRNLDIREDYRVNRPESEDYQTEYGWYLYGYGKERSIMVGTNHVFKAGENEGTKTIPIDDMHHGFFMTKGPYEEGYETYYEMPRAKMPVEMTHDDTSITWKVTIPESNPNVEKERFPLSLDSFTRFRVMTRDIDSGKTEREYMVK